MSRITYLAILAAIAVVPKSALANCSEFVGFGTDGDWVPDLRVQVQETLACETWAFDLDSTTLTYAQNFIAYSALTDIGLEEAMQIARGYYDGAVARHERALLRGGSQSILTDEGIFLSGLKVRVRQMGFLAADIESTQHDCENNESLNTILGRVHRDIDTRRERTNIRHEEGRVRMEQQLRDIPLEQWQQQFPNAVTMDDIRNQPMIKNLLEPDSEPWFLEISGREYFSLLNHSRTAENSTVKICLVEAFEAIPGVAEMTPAQRFWNFPGLTKIAYRLRNEP